MGKVDMIAKINRLLISADVVKVADKAEKIDVSKVAEVVIIGILLVFFILVLITLIMMIFPHLLGNSNKKEKNETANAEAPAQNPQTAQTVIAVNDVNKNDDELISVITAAICAYRSSIGESNELSSFRVVAFKKAMRK